MPTYWSQTLIPTLREAPADSEVPSHQLMLRAGLVRKVGAGSYTYLPLGWRVVQRVSQIIREEMDAAGAAEIFMPTLHPIELWQASGRREDYGDNLFVLQDRHKREYALGPTHEEVATDLIGSMIESYKDLPKTVYQIQTKFRDEFRPRFGVLRSREFIMKDAYSFHLALEGEGGLAETYQKQYDAYCRIFDRCGVPYFAVEAETGEMGGTASHQFTVLTPTGEDTIYFSDRGNYAANLERCEIGRRDYDLHGVKTGDLEDVHTPNCPGIDDVCAFFKQNLGSKLAQKNMLKTLVCRDANGQWVLAVIRGDHDLNEDKLPAALADDTQAKEAGFNIGFIGPQIAAQRDDIRLIVDPDAAQGGFWVTGANQANHHVKHFNWQRDVLDPLNHADPESAKDRVRIADIRNAQADDPSPKDDGGTLQQSKGIEVGQVFQLGDKYTKALDVTVLDEHNQERTPLMGCYGIGVNRILAAAIESEGGHDDNGIIWPAGIAPYDVIITPIKYEGQVKQTVDQLADQLSPLSVLIDDRDLRPGVKFKDADLIGIPLRVTVGDKGLSADPPTIELKARNGDLGPKGESIALDRGPAKIAEVLANG